MPPKNTRSNDFNADSLVSIDKHDADLKLLDGRVTRLEENLGNHEKIADTVCKTTEKQVSMRELFSGQFVRLLKDDKKVQEAITNFMKESDRQWAISIIRRIGWGGWSIILLGVGSIFGGLIEGLGKVISEHIFKT